MVKTKRKSKAASISKVQPRAGAEKQSITSFAFWLGIHSTRSLGFLSRVPNPFSS